MSITTVRPLSFFLSLAALLVVALLLPHFANRGIIFLAGIVAINIVFGIAFNFAFAKAGVLSFGHAMFFAVGAYATGYMTINQDWMPFLLILLVAVAAGALLAIVTALLALRRAGGVSFAVITLALGALIHVIIMKTTVLGRNDGLAGIARPPLDLGVVSIPLGVGDNYYYFLIVTCALAVLLMWVLWSNRFGRSLQAVKSDPARADFLGIDVNAKRLQAFTISGTMAALSGALFAPWAQIVSPEVALWTQSTMPVLFALLGGSAFFLGPAVGAILFGFLDYGTRTMVGVSDLLVGGLLLAVVLAVPGGILGMLSTLWNRFGGRRNNGATPVATSEVHP